MSTEAPDNYAVPLLALDQIESINNAGIKTRKAVSADEPYFIGHFPNCPIFPGVFIIEAVHQAVIHYAANYCGRVRMIEIRSVRFLSPVAPGDLLECDCRCAVRSEDGLLQVKATCYCGSRRVASVNLAYCIEKADDPKSCQD